MAELVVSRKAANIKPSATLAVAGRAAELRAEGKEILNFSAGEPDFQPPTAVRNAVAKQVTEEPIRYAPVPGVPALRDAVAEQMSAYHGQRWSRANVLVSCGAKHSIANLLLATVDPGDEVVIPAPYWVSYPDMVRLADGNPVIVGTQRARNWRLQPEDLEAAIGPKTRFLILNSPGNPTGAGYRREDLRAIGQTLAKKAPQAWIIVDDIYRQLVYDGFQHTSAFSALEGITDQVVVVDGVSKTFAMTGFRIGFLVGPTAVVSAASRIQSQTTSGAATPSQRAALTALTDPTVPGEVAQMRTAFERRRALIVDGLGQIPGVGVDPPDGAFYVFADVSAHVGEGKAHADDIALATWLLDNALVATVPGTPFGAPGFLRISYATADDVIREGVRRIGEALG